MKQKILFVELMGYEKLPNKRALHNCGKYDKSILIINDLTKAVEYLKEKTTNILVCNAPNKELFTIFRHKSPDGVAILFTDLPMENYYLQMNMMIFEHIDHIISNRQDNNRGANELNVCLKKIVNNDYFGLDKFFLNNLQTHSCKVTGTNVISEIKEEIQTFAKKHSLRPNFTRKIVSVAEELLMNSVYSAPLSQFNEIYKEEVKNRDVALHEKHQSTLKYGFDGQIFVISALDPFGSLRRNTFFHYITKVIKSSRNEEIIDDKEHGAGLGFVKILFNSHSIIATVKENTVTEITIIIDTQIKSFDPRKTSKTIQFFPSLSLTAPKI
jgi:hypothetical protein